MSLALEQLVIDSIDHRALGRWWAETLDWRIIADDDEEFEIGPSSGGGAGFLFVIVPELKGVKNRLHLDFRPDNQEAEIESLILRGATRVDIGQGEPSWVVLADPEGNEFCILSSRSVVGNDSPLGGETWESEENAAESEADAFLSGSLPGGSLPGGSPEA
jgi:Glyoxalase-like domain